MARLVRASRARRRLWSVTSAGQRAEARARFEAHAWAQSFALLVEADRLGDLDVDDLQRLAVAAYMLGRDDDDPLVHPGATGRVPVMRSSIDCLPHTPHELFDVTARRFARSVEARRAASPVTHTLRTLPA